MRKTAIDKLCDQYNAAQGFTYPCTGFLYFADVVGDGRPLRRRVWVVLNKDGGVARSILNGTTYKHTAMFLRRELDKIGETE